MKKKIYQTVKCHPLDPNKGSSIGKSLDIIKELLQEVFSGNAEK